jgi:hypothetical protein
MKYAYRNKFIAGRDASPGGRTPLGAPRSEPSGGRCPPVLAGVGEIEHFVQLLTVVHGRVRCIPLADQLVRLVHTDVVLVAVELSPFFFVQRASPAGWYRGVMN